MKILHLTLKKHWFDMIASGEKKEEYRELKPYWVSRLCKGIKSFHSYYTGTGYEPDFKQFDIIRFRNGYSKDARTMDVECLGIDIGEGKLVWGAMSRCDYFIIKLGDVRQIN